MYKWNIDFTLKGSGVVKHCKYEGPEETSQDVILNIFNNKPNNEMVAFRSDDDKSQVFIQVGEIASIDISVRRR